MIRPALILALLAAPAAAETPNLSAHPAGRPGGSAAQLVLAQQAYDTALASGEVMALLAAIRLARSVSLRPAMGWERVTTGNAAADAPVGRSAPDDPAGAAALAIAQNLAGEDPDLQDLVFDLDAQIPGRVSLTAVQAQAELFPGQIDEWRLPLFGEVAAEIGLIGDGDSPLQLTIRDDGGATVCARAATRQPVLCQLTPARNGFFTVSVANTGETANSYRLIGN
jgi:hypothetical protein